MQPQGVAPDRDSLAWCLRQGDVAYHKLATLSPDFLVISPPKTGSTWLADNLRCHPELFVPAVKEIKYFSAYFKWLDLNWYLDHFAPGAGRVKGEASPSYAILPVEKIRLIRRLMPDVKLIFLMRDPVARAWSHARHNYRYQEANFAPSPLPPGGGGLGLGRREQFATGPELISDGAWQENFGHDWPLVSGDYLGQLRRWLTVFPREQLYLGFYEAIVNQPEVLLRDVFRFLGVATDVDFTAFPVGERVLPGLEIALTPARRRILQQMLRERTRELASFLREHFAMSLPAEWQTTLDLTSCQAQDASPRSPEAFRHDLDDRYLSRVLEQEESYPSSPRMVVAGYRGYSLVFHRDRLVALDEGLGHVDLDETSEAQLRQHQESGRCFIAPTLPALKERVDQHLFTQQVAEQRRAVDALQAELRHAHAQIARLDHSLNAAHHELCQAAIAIERLTPWHVRAGRLIKRVGRRVWGRVPWSQLAKR